MLPNDTDFFANDGNEEVTHDWTNSIELSANVQTASETDETYPAPTGTTLSWGGGRIIFYHKVAGVGAGATGVIDDTLDYRNRQVIVLNGGFYDVADKLPGGGAWSGAGGMVYTVPFTATSLWTEDGGATGDPPSANYLNLDGAGNAYIFCESTSHDLRYRNGSAASEYPFMVILVSDQFPTRT